jgi:hypothetical protein
MAFPGLHATDLEDNTPINHVPTPGPIGNVPVSDGNKWVSQALATSDPPIMTLGTMEGELSVLASPLKIYNLYGMDRTITKVFLSVGTAPTGDDLIVDVLVDGVSIYPGDECVILNGEDTGVTTLISSPIWSMNSYLTWEILQVGSSTAGEDLVVHIVHEAAIGGS